MAYINECIDVNTALKKFLQSMRCSRSFQGISYAGKPQAVSSYSFKSIGERES